MEYENRDLLYRLYIEEGMSQREIGEKLDCSARTIGRKLDKYDIDSRDSGGYGNPKAGYVHTPRGYIRSQCTENSDYVYIHQLSAIAGGDSPHKVFDDDNEVHHINGIKWDNRPCNVETKSKREHKIEHFTETNWSGVKK